MESPVSNRPTAWGRFQPATKTSDRTRAHRHQPTGGRSARWYRTLLILFLVATCWKVWVGEPQVLPIASAQIPDSGMQRKVLINEVRITNQLLTQLNATLKSHTFKVRIEGTDKQAAPTDGP